MAEPELRRGGRARPEPDEIRFDHRCRARLAARRGPNGLAEFFLPRVDGEPLSPTIVNCPQCRQPLATITWQKLLEEVWS